MKFPKHQPIVLKQLRYVAMLTIALLALKNNGICQSVSVKPEATRQHISINNGWKFFRYPEGATPDSLIYDARPSFENRDGGPADARPTDAVSIKADAKVLKPWIMPSGNAFIRDPAKRYIRPKGNPGGQFPFVKGDFNDSNWQFVDLPHDWAIKGPFYTADNAIIGGGMGRLPVQGVAWYRKKLNISKADAGKAIYLEVEGAMSYAMVWLNGKLVGGWPYGYSSWQLDLSPYVIPGGDNQLAIRLDNPPASSRWYPGAGIYRNVWLNKQNKIHVSQWGTTVITKQLSPAAATVGLRVSVDNTSSKNQQVSIGTAIYLLGASGQKVGQPVARIKNMEVTISGNQADTINATATIPQPKLWGPRPTQKPNRYVAVTTVYQNGQPVDSYETPFGVREIRFDPNEGVFINGEHIYIKGVNQHHDLGALGTAFNRQAARRQLVELREMGCNAIRLAHNPPAPELLDLADEMGFMVIDEIFDDWETKKTPLDFHLIFHEWSEQDLRALARRDRNHPSVLMWSFGNEVGEQYTGEKGASVAKRLYRILKEEDSTRPSTAAMNYAKPDMPLPAVVDVIGLNYQGEGIRDADAYKGLKGISTPPLYPAFHSKFPDKVIISTENAAALSSRGEYYFPVFSGTSAPVKDGLGGDSKKHQVSAYELYSVDFGSSAEKVLATMYAHPYVAGGFVWSGWDYIGEPTPYYSSRSSYFGIIDLAGFKKDRFYLYQAAWRPELPMAHLLPHWNWPDRIGKIVPVHVFTSGDEGELFVNNISQGRKRLGKNEYRLRWDSVSYQPGKIKVVTYKNGKPWATDSLATAGPMFKLKLMIDSTGSDEPNKKLAFIKVCVTDQSGMVVPTANIPFSVSLTGDAEIIATDNGDATDMTSFAATKRNTFNGWGLIVLKAKPGQTAKTKVSVVSDGLKSDAISLKVKDGEFVE
ncbi:beta-galactosidase [Mucilaginibacter yixingensis]|uniref:Beta-galactosidase n=1 Tax=Mucilaginibacter yixingensis TaxID=1295612 RepID=A0A2T5J998_9SPHI|nr:beta-galactosidase GalB [Mucilaginibacter yixingensis]PTQ96653.1 beta-galactosidase [Mucilaginibacter yixingensis]